MFNAPNLVLVGPMGAGKSSIGKRLARRFGLAFVDSDLAIEAHTGVRIAMIFEMEGEAGFRTREHAMLAELLAGRDQVISTGGGAVLDAGTRALMRTRGCVIHLQVGAGQQLERLARDRSRPLLARGDRAETLRALAAIRDPLYAEVRDLAFDTDGAPAGEAAVQLARRLAHEWHPSPEPVLP